MKIQYVLALLLVAGLMGCGHATMRGSVAMKINNEEAHVCMGDKDVKVGDKVALFKSVCTGGKVGGGIRDGRGLNNCKKVKIGEGHITSILNEHYSAMKVDSGVEFNEGTIVEKE